jgi:cytochrome c oxidase subunit 1
VSRKRGYLAGTNPWGAGTFEWATSSPPANCNFVHPPTCQGREPIWENQPDAAVVTGLRTDIRQALSPTTLDAAPHHRYDLARSSIHPFLVAAATAYALLGGGIFHPRHAVYALVLLTLVLWIWFWTSEKKRRGIENLSWSK